jgi:hypothetical protein
MPDGSFEPAGDERQDSNIGVFRPHPRSPRAA